MSHIREITEADNAAVAALVRDNLEAVGLDIPGTAYFDKALDHLSDCYGREDAKYFVLESDEGEVIGGIGFAGFEAMKDTAELHISEMVPSLSASAMPKGVSPKSKATWRLVCSSSPSSSRAEVTLRITAARMMLAPSSMLRNWRK